jgi:hypothetical protein
MVGELWDDPEDRYPDEDPDDEAELPDDEAEIDEETETWKLLGPWRPAAWPRADAR